MSDHIFGASHERDITKNEALSIIAEHGGYGSTRVYGVIAVGDTAGQIVGIKSPQNMAAHAFSRIYVIER
ncbi:hypothetical protein EV641_106224 [Rhodococcus sp. SMB37]|uniref:hypothetical protein n=1 Tax=Rhodococcus sp. SMB37 TaxID=2512213 RepID=UPI00104FF069|nr:hypothetical protein [Rhodococcus sp. SMB37]TCN53578.1 hypothetical protein EV641_106224 [Rhodococcus sp. SMB37]